MASYTKEQLAGKKVSELREIARKLKLNPQGVGLEDLVRAILKAQKKAEGKGTAADPKAAEKGKKKGAKAKKVEEDDEEEEEEEEADEDEDDDEEEELNITSSELNTANLDQLTEWMNAINKSEGKKVIKGSNVPKKLRASIKAYLEEHAEEEDEEEEEEPEEEEEEADDDDDSDDDDEEESDEPKTLKAALKVIVDLRKQLAAKSKAGGKKAKAKADEDEEEDEEDDAPAAKVPGWIKKGVPAEVFDDEEEEWIRGKITSIEKNKKGKTEVAVAPDDDDLDEMVVDSFGKKEIRPAPKKVLKERDDEDEDEEDDEDEEE